MVKSMREKYIERYLNDIKELITLMKKDYTDRNIGDGINYIQEKLNKIKKLNDNR